MGCNEFNQQRHDNTFGRDSQYEMNKKRHEALKQELQGSHIHDEREEAKVDL